MNTNYSHLARVLAAKHRKKLSGVADEIKIPLGVKSVSTFPTINFSTKNKS